MAKKRPPVVAVKSPVTQYAEDVVAGRILAGRLVRLACERHLRDLEHGHERGLRFDPAAAEHVFEFFSRYLRFAEGAFAGQPFELQPFQKFILGSLFGWKGPDGFRRFRKAYVEISKGSGKTPLAAGIGLYGLVADREAGAEIYAAAVSRDQANILFRDAKQMVAASPDLGKRVTTNVGNLSVAETGSFFRAVSSEARSLDGKRVHMALIDELHEHPSSLVVDKMQAGTKGRRQPLTLCITNSGYDRHSVCWQQHEYSIKVLEGIIPDDGWFAYVACIDEDAGDDWQDEAVWVKANPNLDVSVTRTYLREQVREAQGMPAKANIVKRLNFCIWTEASTRWLDSARWDACGPLDREGLLGRACYAGLDLSSVFDTTCLGLVFPGDDGFSVLPFFWIPEENMLQRVKRDRVPYDLWVEQGWIETTPGNVVDYGYIRKRTKELGELYDIREIAVDRWNSTQLQIELAGDGFEVVPFGQGFASMAAPTKEFEKLVSKGTLRHGGNPVLRWMISNLVVQQDAAGNLKPDKEKSIERIDGPVALIMGLDRATRQEHGTSVYEERGILVL